MLGVGSKNIIFQNSCARNWIRRIGSLGYDVSDLLDTAYRTYWVRRIELFRYGVLGSLGTAYWLFGYGVLSYSGTVHGYAVSSLMDTAYWSSE
ncbi:hypothetical protein Tco_0589822 [Tanacetum coccineum]